MTSVYTYRWEIIVALLALSVHTIVFLAVLDANNGSVLDTVRADDGYFEIATNLLAGNGFSMATTSPFVPNALRTPGYIYFLAGLIGTVGIAGAAIVQLLLSTLIPVLGLHITRRITNSLRIGIATGIILALDPTLALLSFQFYTDTLFLVLFFAWTLLTFRYFERRDWTLLAIGAVVLGLAILVRPTAQFVPLLLVPFILWRFGREDWKHRAAQGIAYLAIIAVILTPWIARNYSEFGAPGLSSQKAYVLYTNFAPAVLSVARGSEFALEFTTFSTYTERTSNVITLKNGDEYIAKALDVIFMYPIATAFVAVKSLFTFFTNDGLYTLLVMTGYEPANFLWLLIPARLVWVAITIAAFVGAFVYLLTRRSQLAILIILLVAYFALTSAIAAFGTNPRYRLPVDPIILALAAVGGAYLLEHARRFWKKP
ncbi:hypothetical protein C4556_01965 [Candidatus Parcubacteria bacterium]|nr:MAG: hypothetical protein C4556_01965 [Candidatus Parcubacteria bacterium]